MVLYMCVIVATTEFRYSRKCAIYVAVHGKTLPKGEMAIFRKLISKFAVQLCAVE